MVLPNSHRVPRVPWYLGIISRKSDLFRLRDCHPLWFRFPADSTINQICNFPIEPELHPIKPHDPEYATLPGLTHIRFRLFPFRSPLLRELFLFLRLLRCFSSPRSPLQPMYSAADVSTLPETGFPIQKSPDQSLFSNSPKLIAAYHVFHRLLVPRHPPFALNSLATK